MPKARSKPVNLHARRAKALAGKNQVTVTLDPRVPGPYSNTSVPAPVATPAPMPDACCPCCAHALPPLPKPLTCEEHELCRAAVQAVLATVRQARAAKKYQAYSWLGETQAHQVAHAFGHVRELQNQSEGVRMREPDEPHAAHLITRAVLLLALQARGEQL